MYCVVPADVSEVTASLNPSSSAQDIGWFAKHNHPTDPQKMSASSARLLVLTKADRCARPLGSIRDLESALLEESLTSYPPLETTLATNHAAWVLSTRPTMDARQRAL